MRVALWAGVTVAPLLWSLAFGAAYAFSYSPCRGGGSLWLSVALPIVVGVLTAAGTWLWWRTITPYVETESAEWARWFATAGLMMSLTFALVLIVTGLPPLFLPPCQ